MVLRSFSIVFLFLSAVTAQVGPCHPFPGAVAPDCLELIGDNLNNLSLINCGATLTTRNCSITTSCAIAQAVGIDDTVRRALTAIGACALSDRGSISGEFTAGNVKTCYLFPGQEGLCS